MRQLTIECGYGALWSFADFRATFEGLKSPRKMAQYKKYRQSSSFYPVDAVRNLKQLFLDNGISLNVVLYGGIKSPWSCGRFCNWEFEQFAETANMANKAGASFMVAFNGGLADHLPPGEVEISALRHLEANNSRYGIRNKVTVLHDCMFQLSRAYAPSLEVIASTLKHLDPRQDSSYPLLFQKHDFVVPLNQHTTYEFLSQFREYAAQMVLFLDFGCANSDLHECYLHALEYELMQASGVNNLGAGFDAAARKMGVAKGDYPPKTPSQIPAGEEGCSTGRLYERSYDLTELIRMGCNTFKVPRDRHVTKEAIGALFDAVKNAGN